MFICCIVVFSYLFVKAILYQGTLMVEIVISETKETWPLCLLPHTKIWKDVIGLVIGQIIVRAVDQWYIWCMASCSILMSEMTNYIKE
jgi:hypothetical protein